MKKSFLSDFKLKMTSIIVGALFSVSSSLSFADTVNILGLFPFSGPYADSGKLTDQGARIALEEVNYTINGKKIKYVTRDSETKAGPAARRAQEAIDTEGVKFIVGPWSSGVALAVTEVAKKNKVMYYFSGGTEDISGKKCLLEINPSSARSRTTSFQRMETLHTLHLYSGISSYENDTTTENGCRVPFHEI